MITESQQSSAYVVNEAQRVVTNTVKDSRDPSLNSVISPAIETHLPNLKQQYKFYITNVSKPSQTNRSLPIHNHEQHQPTHIISSSKISGRNSRRPRPARSAIPQSFFPNPARTASRLRTRLHTPDNHKPQHARPTRLHQHPAAQSAVRVACSQG